MAFAATKATAAMAGAWTGLGMSAFYAWTKQHPWDSSSTQVLGFIVVLLVFFFMPVFIFVFGPDDGRMPVRRLPQVAVRGGGLDALRVLGPDGWYAVGRAVCKLTTRCTRPSGAALRAFPPSGERER